MDKEVLTSYSIVCTGSPKPSNNLSSNRPHVDVSLTIYNDGKRDVGCSHILPNGICDWFEINRDYFRCRHLPAKESTK